MKTKRDIFETRLRNMLDQLDQKSEDYQLIKAAVGRLDQHSEIFVGDPNGVFSYEDQVLATLLYLCNNIETELNSVSETETLELKNNHIAYLDGEIISNDELTQWIKMGLNFVRTYSSEKLELLKSKIPENSIIMNKPALRLAIIGDAGFNGTVQKDVLQRIKKRHKENNFDFLIHLGDIYFGGKDGEMLHNFLGPFRKIDNDIRVFNVIGNHDLYYGNLPILDVLDTLNQPGRFFCIENEKWIIACLDTAVPSASFLSIIPSLSSQGELDEVQKEWLRDLIDRNPQKKIVLMSHHYIDSGWSQGSDKLRRDIQPFIPNIFSWYWGHEHNCSVYDKDTLGYYGACLGNGVFMEKWSVPSTDRIPVWYPEGFCSCSESDYSEGWEHGFLELELSNTKLIERYHLESQCYKREISI